MRYVCTCSIIIPRDQVGLTVYTSSCAVQASCVICALILVYRDEVGSTPYQHVVLFAPGGGGTHYVHGSTHDQLIFFLFFCLRYRLGSILHGLVYLCVDIKLYQMLLKCSCALFPPARTKSNGGPLIIQYFIVQMKY